MNDNLSGRIVASDRSDEAFALAADLVVRFDELALARARMELYAALHASVSIKVNLVTRVFSIMMDHNSHDTIS